MKESKENYLETIYILSQGKDSARSTDIAKKIGVSRPSVFAALENLKENGYIVQLPYGDVTLTAQGTEYAERIYQKHLALTLFLTTTLNIPREVAEVDACKIEHDLSPETTRALLEYVAKIDKPNDK